jgi:hypothetical protein
MPISGFKILGRGGSPLDSMLQRVVDLVPSGWQFSEIAAARIKIEGKAYFSNPFFKENWLYLQILL